MSRITPRSWLMLASLPLCISVALAADKKAEGELRWGLNYCVKAQALLVPLKEGDRSAGRIEAGLRKAEPEHAKFKEYLAKATAIDASVTGSETIYDKKNKRSFAEVYRSCEPLEAEIAALRKQAEGMQANKEAAKEAAEASVATARTHDDAMELARQAINECAIFNKWQGSSELDARIAAYHERKNASLAAWPQVGAESYETELSNGSNEKGTPTKKNVSAWFAHCDKSMPDYLAKLREQEKATAAAGAADAARRSAMNDRIRAEQEAKFKQLLEASKGDRHRILKSKGFLPHRPLNGSPAGAPVWRWEVNITGEATRCETYQFTGDKLKNTSTNLGPCP